MEVENLKLHSVTHRFAYDVLRHCSQLCSLGKLAALYQDLALMRIINSTSKLRTIELLQRYFDVSYSQRTVYRLLPKLVQHKEEIETAAYETAFHHFSGSFALVLFYVTTLYFESHEPDDLRGDIIWNVHEVPFGDPFTCKIFPFKNNLEAFASSGFQNLLNRTNW